MMTTKAPVKQDFQTVLIAPGRSADIPESADAYGWLIGSWELDVLHYWAADVSARGIKAEAHFAWVLEGRVLQDVWIMPRCSERTSDMVSKFDMYGTTLRVWDPPSRRGESRGSIRRGTIQATDRPQERKRNRADRPPTRRHTHALAIHRDHTGLIPLARRVAAG